MDEKLCFGYRYELNDEWKEYYDNQGGVGYHYAVPTDYADNCIIGDCYIVNTEGRIHPGFNVSPVPHNISSLSNRIALEDIESLHLKKFYRLGSKSKFLQ